MSHAPLLVLMGLRGSGKSTLARAIADRLDLPAMDLDPLTLRAMGAATVREAWDRSGEAAFREAEVRALRDVVVSHSQGVLALGGGTPTAPGAFDCLRDAAERGEGAIVYLRLMPDVLRARVHAHDPNRPALTGGDSLDEVDTIFAARDPLYRSLAQHEHAPLGGVDEDADALIRWWVGARG